MLSRLLLILILAIAYILSNRKNITEMFENPENQNIWMYWETKKGSVKPNYIDLCHQTMQKHCKKSFNVHLLNEKTIHDYLPNLRKDLDTKLNIPQKTDYYRYRLLHKYGGIWIDSDTIIMKDLKEITDKLVNYEYVGFGCHYRNCKNGGYPKPANWVMASRKNSKLMKLMMDDCDKILDKGNINYHSLGRDMLWKNIDYLRKNEKDWDYYHYDSKCLERDSRDRKMRNHISLSDEDIDSNCEGKHLFIPIYNTNPGFPGWFKNMSKEEILKSNLLIGKTFRKSLNLK